MRIPERCFFPVLLLASLAAPAQEAKSDKRRADPPPNDPAARSFLREAEGRTASWEGIAGFAAEITVYWEGKTHQGTVQVVPDGKPKVDLPDPDARKWASSVLASIAATSKRDPFDVRYKSVGIVFGKDDRHPQGQLVETHGDPYQTKFRILDGEIRSIERTVGDELVLLNILAIERDTEHRKRARSFVVNYFDKKTGNFLRSEAIRDRRVIVEGYVLPEVWKEFRAGKGGAKTQALFLSGHALLPDAKTESGESR